MADREHNKRVLLELLKRPGNANCADCGDPDPDWASYKLGVFICLNCSGIHRNLTEISRVKSIRLDFWDDDLVEFMKANGNAVAKERYEKNVPAFFYRPQATDCAVLREQWIRAKYERQEFSGNNEDPRDMTCSGCHEGFLWKRGKDNRQFVKRKFILSGMDFTLMYYTKQVSKGPKAVISIKDLNVTFQPEKIKHPHGLQITYLKEDHTRSIFVYHEGTQEIVSWFNAIRAARFSYLKTAFPTASDSELVPLITRNYLKEGYMEKTGPMQREPFKKRWFILDSQDRKLLYFKDPLEAVEKGSVFIGNKEHGYKVTNVLPKGVRGSRWKCGITVETPERQFIFTCENEREQREWMEALNQVISKPMSPQDYTMEANVRRRR
ncbi:arf-GAP with dual PH domain-containing protein 2-like [Acipenser ruthenus]|uniref:arf-GAP with dual PH domain-containing protein 2-like n=1 Tax=Acipenser ruthenus TaxID=7906 RepID=UPI00145B009D|nr:arf-GAP with dual PH domain-containing protein 2-like [Acipenser ruthenus]XP_033894637.1 arf-GAP with dual PH domain-containing protein 2-like [Acipenser ruthenus]XP_033894638.1 arf-GAP with dual PH domain-containing protein 2-like [Acipenser ruthenus]